MSPDKKWGVGIQTLCLRTVETLALTSISVHDSAVRKQCVNNGEPTLENELLFHFKLPL